MKRVLVIGLALMVICSLSMAKKEVPAKPNRDVVEIPTAPSAPGAGEFMECVLFHYDTASGQCSVPGWYWSGEVMKNYFDPADCQNYQPPSPYPFQVDSLWIPICFSASIPPGVYTFMVDIECADLTDPDCPYPGLEVCTYTFDVVNPSPSQAWVYDEVIPISCCMSQPFFMSLHFLNSPVMNVFPGLLYDTSAVENCVQWYNYPTPWIEWHNTSLHLVYGLGNWVKVLYGDANESCVPEICPGECIHQPEGDLCDSPIVLPGEYFWSETFNLCDYCNDYDLEPCTGWPSNSEDIVLEFTWVEGEPDEWNDLYVLAVPTTTWDISIAVISECGNFGPTSCIEGADDNGPGWPEAINLDDQPNGTFYIIVSGFMRNCGPFDICISSNHPLPVELLSFEGTPGDEETLLTWTTASETDNSHFYLIRGTDARNYQRISGDIPGTNSPTGSTYSYVDGNLVNGTTYYYKLVDVDINGLENVNIPIAEVTPSPESPLTPDEYALHQNYPNPFNPTTTITYDIKDAGFVTLTVFDILGREVATLVNSYQDAARYSVEFDVTNYASGIYFYQMKVNEFTDLKKMVVLK